MTLRYAKRQRRLARYNERPHASHQTSQINYLQL